MTIETERLRLVPFTNEHRHGYRALRSDPQVMRFFPSTLAASEADVVFDKILTATKEEKVVPLAAHEKASGAFVGLIGLGQFRPEIVAAIPGHPEFEVGWIMLPQFWGKGFAPEGATATINARPDWLARTDIVAITYRGNLPSQRVMEKIGMRRDLKGDFEHPSVPEGNKVRAHVLYRFDD